MDNARNNKAPLDRELLIIIGLNLFPILGLMFFHWSILDLLLVYWMETAVATVFGVARWWRSPSRSVLGAASILVAAVLYLFVCLLGIAKIFGPWFSETGYYELSDAFSEFGRVELVVSALILSGSHAWKFWQTRADSDSEDVSGMELLKMLLQRTVLLMVTIVGGYALITVVMSGTIAILIVFIGLKLGLEFGAYRMTQKVRADLATPAK